MMKTMIIIKTIMKHDDNYQDYDENDDNYHDYDAEADNGADDCILM